MNRWYQMRTPQYQFWSLTDRPGSIVLHGNGVKLDVDESPAILLTRQLSFKATFDLDLEFNPKVEGEEAGLAIWYSKWNHARIGVKGVNDDGRVQRQVYLQRPDVKVTVPMVSVWLQTLC